MASKTLALLLGLCIIAAVCGTWIYDENDLELKDYENYFGTIDKRRNKVIIGSKLLLLCFCFTANNYCFLCVCLFSFGLRKHVLPNICYYVVCIAVMLSGEGIVYSRIKGRGSTWTLTQKTHR